MTSAPFIPSPKMSVSSPDTHYRFTPKKRHQDPMLFWTSTYQFKFLGGSCLCIYRSVRTRNRTLLANLLSLFSHDSCVELGIILDMFGGSTLRSWLPDTSASVHTISWRH